jgi:hypothetical protein
VLPALFLSSFIQLAEVLPFIDTMRDFGKERLTDRKKSRKLGFRRAGVMTAGTMICSRAAFLDHIERVYGTRLTCQGFCISFRSQARANVQ